LKKNFKVSLHVITNNNNNIVKIMYLYTHKGLILGGYYLVIKMLLVNIDTCSAVA